MEQQLQSARRRPSFRRAFLPFFVALICGLAIFCWDYHVRHAPLTRLAMRVTVEGRLPEEKCTVVVGGQLQDLENPVTLGFAKIRISTPDTEPQIRNRFIWYGVTDLGTVDLVRSRGSITAHVLPRPESYELRGRLGNWTNASGVFQEIPVGHYRLVGRFGRLTEGVEVDVKRNETNKIELAAQIGSLELLAETAEGDFDLISASGERRFGSFPLTFPHLDAGSYRLVAKKPGYEREVKLEVRRNETNRFLMKFVYGAAEITTSPAGASIVWAGKAIGTTPIALTNLVPGKYPLETKLNGYDTVSNIFTIEGNVTTNLAITLVNTKYREEMAEAHENIEQKHFDRAARHLEAALVAVPGDALASSLLPSIRPRGLRELAEALAQQGEFGEALRKLDSALKDVPDDAPIKELREKFRRMQTEADQKELQSRFHKLMADSKSAADRQDFDSALALLEKAKKILPENPELPQLESSLRINQKKRATELDEKQKKDEIAERKKTFERAFQQALSSEKDEASFALQRLTTTKTASEVLSALERISSAELWFRMRALNSASPSVFTAKLGEMAQGFSAGQYIRIGVATFEKGHTEISLKVFYYGEGVPENARIVLRHFDRFRKKLAAELGNDLN